MLGEVSERPEFCEAMLEAFAHHKDGSLTPFCDALKTIDFSAAKRPKKCKLEHQTMRYLDHLKSEAFDTRFARAAEDLDWSQIYEGDGLNKDLAEGMLAAQCVGTYGRHPSDKVATGLFLLAPDIHYPLHTHAASEVYLCVSGRLQLRHGMHGASFDLRRGELSITPSGRVHELKTYSEPVMLAYLWIGDLTAPTWWWEQTSNDTWQRVSWTRIPGEPWKQIGVEPISQDDIQKANA